MEISAKTVNGFQSLTIFLKSSISITQSLQRRDHNVLKQPMAHSLPSSRLPAINLVRKEISSSVPRHSAFSYIFENVTERLKHIYLIKAIAKTSKRKLNIIPVKNYLENKEWYMVFTLTSWLKIFREKY